jgi:hypothetical protein
MFAEDTQCFYEASFSERFLHKLLNWLNHDAYLGECGTGG